MAWQKQGGPPCGLYRLAGRQVTDSSAALLSNGLDWSDDRKHHLFADGQAGGWTSSTPTRTGALSARRRFTTIDEGILTA